MIDKFIDIAGDGDGKGIVCLRILVDQSEFDHPVFGFFGFDNQLGCHFSTLDSYMEFLFIMITNDIKKFLRYLRLNSQNK